MYYIVVHEEPLYRLLWLLYEYTSTQSLKCEGLKISKWFSLIASSHLDESLKYGLGDPLGVHGVSSAGVPEVNPLGVVWASLSGVPEVNLQMSISWILQRQLI